MRLNPVKQLDKIWLRHNEQWRQPAQVISCWEQAGEIDSKLLSYKVTGDWWKILAECAITLFVTREYEHLTIAMSAGFQGPVISYLRIPHPSGLVVNRKKNVIYLASTRNPNQVYTLKPASSLSKEQLFVPVSSRFYPGCLYVHDLVLIGGKLYANAVGRNTVVRLQDDGKYGNAWWPRCIERKKKPMVEQNYIQLNSIASGASLNRSYFSASTDIVSSVRPGDRNFPVDKRGVIFSGASREVVVRGLTRPHSIRWHRAKVWIDNSGYGEFGFADFKNAKFVPVIRLPGWTRGLCFYKDVAFVGISRVIPRFYKYAPGLDVEKSLCGIYAIDVKTSKILGSIIWPSGNQIFAIDWIKSSVSPGLVFSMNKKAALRTKRFFYSFKIGG